MERANHIYLANLAMETGRFQDAINSVKNFCAMDGKLSTPERKLLRRAYKSIVQANRSTWSTIQAHLEEHNSEGETELHKLLREFSLKVEADQQEICMDCINLIDTYLISATNAPDSVVRNTWMKGHYYYYLAEININSEKQRFASLSERFYMDAKRIALNELPKKFHIHLRIVLNLSALYHYIYLDTKRALERVNYALEKADMEMDGLEEDIKRKSDKVLKKLREYSIRWTEQPNN